MERLINEQPDEDSIDNNCRLRHGLNVHCLAKIFQYLDTLDLLTVGEMNAFYRQIIDNFVISKHRFNIKPGDMALRVFERYGPKIRKININIHIRGTAVEIINLFSRFCSHDELRDISIDATSHIGRIVLPLHFARVEKFHFAGYIRVGVILATHLICEPLSASLRYLSLDSVKLDRNFSWTGMKNLTELKLRMIDGINIQHFIEFLRLRPNLKVLHLNTFRLFGNSKQEVFAAFAEYCGNQIQDFCDESNILPPLSFIAALEKLKSIYLPTNQISGGDLVAAIRQLARNNTIEKLKLSYHPFQRHSKNCILQKDDGFGMNHFGHLKTIHIKILYADNTSHRRACDTSNIFSVYSSQMLSHVEKLILVEHRPVDFIYDWNFIKFVPNLRHLIFIGNIPNAAQADQILSMLETILRTRHNDQTSGDFIEVKFSNDQVLNVFVNVAGQNDHIKLIKLQERERDKLIGL